jgi:hypothetical protein
MQTERSPFRQPVGRKMSCVREPLEADGLVELFAACHRVLAHPAGCDHDLSIVIPQTCTAVERRLADLGVVADGPDEEPLRRER